MTTEQVTIKRNVETGRLNILMPCGPYKAIELCELGAKVLLRDAKAAMEARKDGK